MNFELESFFEGPLLWAVFLIFVIAVFARLVFFAAAIIRSSRNKNPGAAGYSLAIFGRFFAPFHMGVQKKPLYAVLRYVFHLCLVVVPIWLGGHIVLWEESRLEWDWISMPQGLADGMTIILIILATYFLGRRITVRDTRLGSSPRDYIIICLTALPFLTGYFLAHGGLDDTAFLGDNMRAIHVLSGEAMILMAAFLFCRTRMNPMKCTGCAACELACPTGTLESNDNGRLRTFNYSHYQCICCASCINTCPEGAAELRHQFSLPRFFQALGKHQIREVELHECERCGEFFAPEPLMDKLGKTFTHESLQLCPNCRKMNLGDVMRNLSPWHRKPVETREKPKLFIKGH